MEKTIGLQLREARTSLGMTLKELSEKSSVSVDTINGLETGRRKSTSLTILQLLSMELGITFQL